ncbi:MAG: hypothetical protein AAF846_24960 [Chloroflexota bacterium]
MINLVNSTGDAHIDNIIQAVIGIYEATFPEQIQGYYLIGSYGDDSAIRGSDVDMMIIFKGTMTESEKDRCDTLKTSCRVLTPVHLDLPVIAEADFHQVDTVALKLSSKFVYGEDTRESIPLPSMETYLYQISMPTQRGLTIRFRQEQVTLPLDYPDANDAYFGYIPAIYQDSDTPIKLWVLNVGWLATFLVVHRAGVYVPSKRHMLPLYRKYIHDKWTDFIADVYTYGRNKWHYQLPHSDEELKLFRELCQQTLAFENHVASIYVDWLKQNHQLSHYVMGTERLQAFNIS